MTATIHHGDCLEVLRGMPDNSVDAVVTDPPYGLSNTSPLHIVETMREWANGNTEYVPAVSGGFMGAAWDSFVPPPAVWAECYRVLKPGGHLATFSGTRTIGLMDTSVRLAGFDHRDTIGAALAAWVTGQGFPKSLNVAKATGNPAHEGLGTAMKPSWEPILLYRKPLSEKTVASNVLTHGTGALNIDQSRIGMSDADRKAARVPMVNADGGMWNKLGSGRDGRNGEVFEPHAGGRWPANVLLDPVTAEALDQQSGIQRDGVATNRNRGERIASTVNYANHDGQDHGYGGQGGASRFFKVVEPDTAFREDLKSRTPRRSESNFDVATGRPLGPARLMERHVAEPDPPFMYAAKAPKKERPSYVDEDGKTVQHSTVKPLSICRWLVRLCVPEGGTVLDPFAGSGTTVEAAILEGFNVIGIEREEAYLPLIQQRIDRATDQLPLAS